MTLRQDAEQIIRSALQAAMPDTAVKKALASAAFGPVAAGGDDV